MSLPSEMYDRVDFMKVEFPVWYSMKGYSFPDEQMCVSVHSTCWASFSLYLTEIHESTPPRCTKTGSQSQRGGRDERKWGWERAVFCPCKVNGCSICKVSRHSSRAVSLTTATASHLVLSSERSGQERVNSGTSLPLPHWLCTSSRQRVNV